MLLIKDGGKLMAKSKKAQGSAIFSILILAFAVVAIVGLFLDYVGTSVSGSIGDWGGSSEVGYIKLFDMEETWGTISIIAGVAAAALCALTAIVGLLKSFGVMNTGNVGKLFGLLSLVCGIFAIVAVFVWGGQYSDSIGGDFASITVTTAPAIGAWLVCVGSVLGGALGVASK